MRTCPVCDVEVPTRPGRGRQATYCSTRCRVAAHRAGRLPVELTSRDRWVQWKPLSRSGNWTKMPVQANGRPASSTNPTTWAPHTAVKASKRLGFVLGDSIGCIDLDHALDESGAPKPWAAAILAATPETFVEVSPSGDGLHIWGLLPAGPGRVIRDGVRAVEVYSSARYMTVTGKRWPGSVSRLADLSDLVATL